MRKRLPAAQSEANVRVVSGPEESGPRQQPWMALARWQSDFGEALISSRLSGLLSLQFASVPFLCHGRLQLPLITLISLVSGCRGQRYLWARRLWLVPRLLFSMESLSLSSS